jgi:hypothetical protein
MSFYDLAKWSNQPWESDAERIAAFSSPRYSDPYDSAYRDAVIHKTHLSMSTAEPDSNIRVGNGPNQVYVETPGSNTLREIMSEEEIARDFSPATPAEIQRFADLQDGAADHPMALDYKNLKITPKRQTPESTTPSEPSFFTDEGQIARYGKTIRQIRQEEKQAEAQAQQQEERETEERNCNAQW